MNQEERTIEKWNHNGLDHCLADPRPVSAVLRANGLTAKRRPGPGGPYKFDILDDDAVLFTGRPVEVAQWLRATGRVNKRMNARQVGLHDEAANSAGWFISTPSTAAGLALIAEQGPALASSEIDPAPGLSPTERR